MQMPAIATSRYSYVLLSPSSWLATGMANMARPTPNHPICVNEIIAPIRNLQPVGPLDGTLVEHGVVWAAGFCRVFTCKTRDYAAIIAGEFPDGLREIVPAYSAFIRIMVDGISFDARSMYYMHQGISQVSGKDENDIGSVILQK